MSGPAAVPPENVLVCDSCEWRGEGLMDGKRHALEEKGTPWEHGVIEVSRERLAAAPDTQGVHSLAVRYVYRDPRDPQKVRVVAAATRRKQFKELTGPLVKSAAAKRRRG